jgi:hypothetical protein
MGVHHVRVVRVDHGSLKRPIKKIPGIPHEILIQRIWLPDKNRHGFSTASSNPSTPLPSRDNGSGITDKDARIQTPNIDPHLEGAR